MQNYAFHTLLGKVAIGIISIDLVRRGILRPSNGGKFYVLSAVQCPSDSMFLLPFGDKKDSKPLVLELGKHYQLRGKLGIAHNPRSGLWGFGGLPPRSQLI
jgi:hypothetical protein